MAEEMVEVVEEFDPAKVPFGWTPYDFPLYFADGRSFEDIAKAARFNGHSVYYVLGADGSKAMGKKTKLWKIIDSFVGHAAVVTEDDLGFELGVSEAYWNMPDIPLIMINKLDSFFRAVDQKHHTESIVMLGYDTRLTGEEGWCVLVPEQFNTSGSCDYKYESVVEEKDDEIVIVGSAHSHPGMSAFASHTDHKDQASFDGLHITFGWTATKPTEFHIEFQIGGQSFNLKPEQVFEDVPTVEVDEEVAEWITKVKKKYGAGTTTHGPTSQGSGYTSPLTTGSTNNSFNGTNAPGSPRRDTIRGWPDFRNNCVVVEILEKESTCPICRHGLFQMDRDRRSCGICMAGLVLPEESYEDWLKARVASQGYATHFDPIKCAKPIAVVRRRIKKEGKQEWMEQNVEWVITKEEISGKV